MSLNEGGYTSNISSQIYKAPGVYVQEKPEYHYDLDLKDKSVAIEVLNMIDIEIIQEYVRAKKLKKIKGIK